MICLVLLWLTDFSYSIRDMISLLNTVSDIR